MFVALIPPVVSQISPDEKLGARVGAFFSVLSLASLIGTPVGGVLIKHNTREGYQGVIIYAVSYVLSYSTRCANVSAGMHFDVGRFGHVPSSMAARPKPTSSLVRLGMRYCSTSNAKGLFGEGR